MTASAVTNPGVVIETDFRSRLTPVYASGVRRKILVFRTS
jgi:hypothetical protein